MAQPALNGAGVEQADVEIAAEFDAVLLHAHVEDDLEFGGPAGVGGDLGLQARKLQLAGGSLLNVQGRRQQGRPARRPTARD